MKDFFGRLLFGGANCTDLEASESIFDNSNAMTATQFHLNGSMIDRQNDPPGLLSTGSRSVLAQPETGGLYSPTPMPNQSERCLY